MILSSTAEAVYWLGRYLERAECTARILIEHVHLHIDLPRGLEVGWAPLLALTGAGDVFHEHEGEATEDTVLAFLIGADGRNDSSIITSLALAREDMRTTRPALPAAAWEVCNDLFLYASECAEDGVARRGRFRYLRNVVESCQKLTGILESTMSHDEVYAFLRIGRHLERADMTTRVLDIRAETLAPGRAGRMRPFDDVQWMSTLRAVDAFQMYRRAVGAEVQGPATLQFLIHDRRFPRSVAFCVDDIVAQLDGLPEALAVRGRCDELGELLAGVRSVDIDHRALHRFVDDVQIELAGLHELLAERFFAGVQHAETLAVA